MKDQLVSVSQKGLLKNEFKKIIEAAKDIERKHAVEASRTGKSQSYRIPAVVDFVGSIEFFGSCIA